jgi:hypothetical protein
MVKRAPLLKLTTDILHKLQEAGRIIKLQKSIRVTSMAVQKREEKNNVDLCLFWLLWLGAGFLFFSFSMFARLRPAAAAC